MRTKLLLAAGVMTLSGLISQPSHASDHDDGQTQVKSKALNLTDLYVFREGDQTGVAADNSNLILVMNTNDRSLARQQYYFNSKARYEFHITRHQGANAPVTTQDDILIRLEFADPDTHNQQAVTLTIIRDGSRHVMKSNAAGDAILTTTIGGPGAPTPINNQIAIGGAELTLFAGLREDPFFFDVEAFFRLRAALAGFGPAPETPFRAAAEAVDFTKGYNVNSIVLRLPIAFLEGEDKATTFDVWSTISLLQE